MIDLSLPNPQWAAAPSLKEPRTRLAVVACGGRIYAIGGQGREAGALDTVEVLDPDAAAPAWRTLDARMPYPRRGHAAATDGDGSIFVGGGQDESGSRLRSVWELDLAAGAWRVRARCALHRTAPVMVCFRPGHARPGGPA